MHPPEITDEDDAAMEQAVCEAASAAAQWPDAARALLSRMLADGRLCLPLPAEPPEGHERVRVALYWDRGEHGWWETAAMDPREVASDAHAIITADVPIPRPVEIVGRVE